MSKKGAKQAEKPLGVIDESGEVDVNATEQAPVEEVKQEPPVEVPEVIEKVEPEVGAPEAPTVSPTVETKPFTIDMAKIDKEKLFRMFYALVMSQPQPYVGVPGSRRIGLILGAQTTKAQLEAWAEVKSFINDLNKAKAQS